MYKIGIVGRGFVGSAVEFGFSPQTGCDVDDLYIYDKDKSRSLHSLEDLVLYSDFIFLSVPTPSNEDGSINLSYVEDALQRISEITAEIEQEISPVPTDLDNIVLIRSTVTPGTTKSLQQKYQNLRLVFNPEFLTERSANFDFISQPRFILGGKKNHTSKVEKLFRHRFGKTISIIKTDFQTAELVKYACNTFFATKISFLNEIKLIAEKVGANWEDVIESLIRDGRVGNSHLNVPGPDGKLGFGGSCFPKDIMALIAFAKQKGIEPHTLNGVWETNLNVRPEKDWENLLGRAIVDEES